MRLRSFDDLGTPLHDVTFCVVDVETTGGSPAGCAITEVGAARFRGGERLGTFQTLVNPGVPVPPETATVTGITSAMVLPAPPIGAVLPSLLEFVGGAVLVGHNLRFDVAFLDAALAATGRPPLGQHRVDTVALARRLVRGDPDGPPDCRLATLADRFLLAHRPCHRALDDALATGDLLHVLIERAAAFGAFGLDDLLALPRVAGHPQAGKLRLTARLPRAPGVYVFRDRAGRPLRVGRAADLRSRVRSHFSMSAGDRGVTASLLRETQTVDHVTCGSSLEAAVLEVRLVHAHAPRYNRRGARWRSYRYVVLTGGRRPRLVTARTPPRRGTRAVLGPLPSLAAARQVIAAIESVMPLGSPPVEPRRPAPAPGAAREPAGPGTPGPSGDPPGPRAPSREQARPRARGLDADRPGPAGSAGPAPVHGDPAWDPATVVDRGLGAEPELLLRPLAARVQGLAGSGRHDAAATARDQASGLARALRRQRQFDALRRAGRIVVALPTGRRIELIRGRLLRAEDPAETVSRAPGTDEALRRPPGTGRTVPHPPGADELARWLSPEVVEPPPADGPVPLEMADELACVAAWLDRHADQVTLVHVDGELSSPVSPGADLWTFPVGPQPHASRELGPTGDLWAEVVAQQPEASRERAPAGPAGRLR